jgi:RNA polymerase sigma factor (sigma-70 family)
MPEEPDDQQLLDEFTSANSEAAFAAIVARYVNLVYSTGLRFAGDPQAAEEISQAVFIILARKAGGLRRGVVLSGWLYQTARLTAANYVKHEIRRQRRDQEAYMQSTLNEADAPAWEEIAPLLDEAMGGLGEMDRNAVVLRFFENKSAREVATALKVSEAAAHKRMHRAVEKLRGFFAKRGVVSTVTVITGVVSANSVHAAPVGLANIISTTALAKGAVVSASTLTLVHGALKLMAWTKTKITIIASVAALLTIGGGTVASIAIMKAMDASNTKAALARMQGDWEGTLDANGGKLRLVFKIFKTNDTYQAVMQSVDQGSGDVPIPNVSARPRFIHFFMPVLDADFIGTLDSDQTAMTGTFKQMKRSFPLTLTRTAEPDTTAVMTDADYTPKAGSDLQGAWEGILGNGNVALHLTLKIAEPSPGTFQAQLADPDQGMMNLPANSLTYHAPNMHVQWDAFNAAFDGEVNNQDDKLVGAWKQNGNKQPLTFRRAQAGTTPVAEEQKDYGTGAPDQIQGHWKGILSVKDITLHIVIHVAQMPDGSYSATMDSPDQGANGIPASAVKFTFPNVRIGWKGIGYYVGKLNAGKLSGSWNQGGAALPLRMERDKSQ